MLRTCSFALFLTLSTFTATGLRKNHRKSRKVPRVSDIREHFDPTCVEDGDNVVCPYLTESNVNGIVNLEAWENYSVSLSLANLTLVSVDPSVRRTVNSRLWLLRLALGPAMNFAAEQATQFINGIQDQAIDLIAGALGNITDFPVVGDIVDAVLKTVKGTKRDVTAEFSPPQTKLDRIPNMDSPGFCSTRDVEVEISGSHPYLVRNAQFTPVARTFNFDTGCDEVWTLECHTRHLVRTTYCPMAEPSVTFQCMGGDVLCWFNSRTINAPRNGTIAFRRLGVDGWGEAMASGSMRLTLRRVTSTPSTPILDGNEDFTGYLGPSFTTQGLTLTFPEFVPKLASNLCAPLGEPILVEPCAFAVRNTLRLWEFVSDVADLNFIVSFQDDALVVALPLDFTEISGWISEAVRGQIGDLIPGFDLEDIVIKLQGVESRILAAVQLFLSGSVFQQ